MVVTMVVIVFVMVERSLLHHPPKEHLGKTADVASLGAESSVQRKIALCVIAMAVFLCRFLYSYCRCTVVDMSSVEGYRKQKHDMYLVQGVRYGS